MERPLKMNTKTTEISTTETPTTRTGIKTSEFALTVAMFLLTFLNSKFDLGLDVAELGIIVAGVITYVISRTIAKKPVPRKIVKTEPVEQS